MKSERKPLPPMADQANLSNFEWLAFLYLSDELTSDQRTEFEAALANDPAAAEALQAMVAVTLQVQAGSESTANPATTKPEAMAKSSEWRPEERDTLNTKPKHSIRWLVGLAASLLLLIGGSQFFAPRGSDSNEAIKNESASDGEMAEVWFSDFEDEFMFAVDRLEENSNLDFGDSKTQSSPVTDAQSESEAAEEDWLYSALVSLESTEDWPSEGQGGS